MNPIGHPPILVPVLLTALIAWRFYRRFRRLVGRQQLSKVRPWVTVCVFPALLVLLGLGSRHQPVGLLMLLGGSMVGVGLGIYGLRATRYEHTSEGLFYTPSAHLGIALSLVLLARIAYRMFRVYAEPGSAGAPAVPLASTPLTLLIFGALAAYYVTYAIGLLRWRRDVEANPPSVAATSPP